MSDIPFDYYPKNHLQRQIKDTNPYISTPLGCKEGFYEVVDLYHLVYAVYHDHRGLKDSHDSPVVRIGLYCKNQNCKNLSFHNPKNPVDSLQVVSLWYDYDHVLEFDLTKAFLLTVNATALFSGDSLENIHSRRTDMHIRLCVTSPDGVLDANNSIEKWVGVGLVYDPVLNRVCRDISIKPTYFPFSYLPTHVTNAIANSTPKRSETPGMAMCLKGWWDGLHGKGNTSQMLEYFSIYKTMGVRKAFVYCRLEDQTYEDGLKNQTFGARADVVELLQTIQNAFNPEEFSIEIICNRRRKIVVSSSEKKDLIRYPQLLFQSQVMTYMDCHLRASEHYLILPHIDADEFLLPSMFEPDHFKNPRSLYSLIMDEDRIAHKVKAYVDDLRGFKESVGNVRGAFSPLMSTLRSVPGQTVAESILRDPKYNTNIAASLTGSYQFVKQLEVNVKKDELKFIEWIKKRGRDQSIALFCASMHVHLYAWNPHRISNGIPSAYDLPIRSVFTGFFGLADRAKCLFLNTLMPSSTMHDLMFGADPLLLNNYSSIIMHHARMHHFRELEPAWSTHHQQEYLQSGFIYDHSMSWFRAATLKFAFETKLQKFLNPQAFTDVDVFERISSSNSSNDSINVNKSKRSDHEATEAPKFVNTVDFPSIRP
eukprot:GDKK01057558.1.p1 GENE.GDKK01057558.1~~GDKK01057558.1.p1  ORF type:complete len:748 (+),score=79.56 GDKK01057558.1:294-2246(+)